MLKFVNFFSRCVFYFQLILLLTLVLTFSLGSILRRAELYKNLPLVHEAAVFSLSLPSPKPSALLPTNIASKSVEKIPVEKKVLSGSTSSQLCQGKKDAWTLVPNPGQEGLYTICNVTVEKMATVSELNAAQNSYRVEHGLGNLNINSKLCEVAAGRAAEVSKNFSHDGFKSAVEGSGLGKSSYGENIASGPLSGVHFVEWSWDKSPGHRANMLEDWTEGCAGVSGKYAVFLFAK